MPRRAAAVHEAGHAVIFESEGVPVRSVRVISRVIRGKEQWGGLAEAGQPWLITPDTPVAVVLQRIRFDLAGVLAEVVALGDEFLPGSSLDEVARARILARRAAFGRPDLNSAAIYAEQGEMVARTLTKHQGALLELANLLLVDEVVRGPRLAAILAPAREGGR